MAAVLDMEALVVQGRMTPSRIAIKAVKVMGRKPSQKISFPVNRKVQNQIREHHVILGIFSSLPVSFLLSHACLHIIHN